MVRMKWVMLPHLFHATTEAAASDACLRLECECRQNFALRDFFRDDFLIQHALAGTADMHRACGSVASTRLARAEGRARIWGEAGTEVRHLLQLIARNNDGGMPNMRLKVRLM